METMDLNCWGKTKQCSVLKNCDHANYTVCTLNFCSDWQRHGVEVASPHSAPISDRKMWTMESSSTWMVSAASRNSLAKSPLKIFSVYEPHRAFGRLQESVSKQESFQRKMCIFFTQPVLNAKELLLFLNQFCCCFLFCGFFMGGWGRRGGEGVMIFVN